MSGWDSLSPARKTLALGWLFTKGTAALLVGLAVFAAQLVFWIWLVQGSGG